VTKPRKPCAVASGPVRGAHARCPAPVQGLSLREVLERLVVTADGLMANWHWIRCKTFDKRSCDCGRVEFMRALGQARKALRSERLR
jgi:hypothetical protein